jgi:hypothetical protein
VRPGAEARRESPEVHDAVRRAVRAVLLESPVYSNAGAEDRRALAGKLVSVGLVAARMLEEDDKLTREIRERAPDAVAPSPSPPLATAQSVPIATAQDASDQLGMRAVSSAAQTVRNLRDSIAFPEFVQSLITGTFQAILTSSTVQIGSLGELLDNVAASADDFNQTMPDGDVRSWATQRFTFLVMSEGTVAMRDPEGDLHQYDAQLKAALSASDDEVSGIDSSDIEGTLLPLVRRKMGRDRQGVLATLVQMGLQRIVVDEGRLEASMDLRVDAQSMSQQDTQALDTLAVNAGASGSFGFGPWGASIQASTSVGRVRSDHQYTAEQIAARAGLRSSVQLAFRTEQVPLDRMVDSRARVRISQNARVPDVSEHSILDGTQSISGAVQQSQIPTAPTAPPIPQSPDSVRLAQQGEQALARIRQPPAGTTTPPPPSSVTPPATTGTTPATTGTTPATTGTTPATTATAPRPPAPGTAPVAPPPTPVAPTPAAPATVPAVRPAVPVAAPPVAPPATRP